MDERLGTSQLAVRRPRITARARITTVFTGLLLACGLAMLGILYLVMRYIPTYSLQSTRPDADPSTAATGTAFGRAIPVTPDALSAPTDEFARANFVIRSADDVLGVLLTSSGAVLFVMVAIGAVASWVVAGRLLKPVHDLTVAARIAAEGSLDHRIGLDGPADEFTELSDTFDDMLERLQRSFGAYERFAANASHELQTPLTTSKTILELARNQPDVDVDRLIDRLDTSNERSIKTVSALLDLADSSHGELRLESVDLGLVVDASLATVMPEALASGVRLTQHDRIGARAEVHGHAVLLERLVTNLLVNAVRHNAHGGHADIEMDRAGGAVTLTVSNSGERIDSCTVQALTEPFFRGTGRVASSARPRGHGLGLTLAANIAEAHGTALEVIANPDGGLTVSVSLSRVVT